MDTSTGSDERTSMPSERNSKPWPNNKRTGVPSFSRRQAYEARAFIFPHPVSLSQDVAERIKSFRPSFSVTSIPAASSAPSGRTKSTRLTELPSDDTDGSNTDTNGRVKPRPSGGLHTSGSVALLSCKAWYCRGSILPSRGSTHGKSSARACPVATSSCGCRRPRHRGVP